jgi:hypothetical protein
MDYKKMALAGVAYAVVSTVLHSLGSLASMKYYLDPSLLPFWSRLMMPSSGMPGLEFYAASISFSFILGCFFAYAYNITSQAFQARNQAQTGLRFGAFLFLLSAVPGFFMVSLMFALPPALVLSWQAESLAICLIFGVAMARIYGK